MKRRWKMPSGLTAAQKIVAQRKRERERANSYKAAHIAAGRRSDGKPRALKKPCGCLAGSCLKCVKRGNKRILMAEQIQLMHADYQTGMTLCAVGQKYPQANGQPRSHGCVRDLFTRRGLTVRPAKEPALGFGVRIPEPTEKEIRALIARMERLSVPAEIKIHWRRWSMTKRQAFIKKLRGKFPSTRPTAPFSKNVTPFIYGDACVHAIADKMNEGRNSRTKLIALKPGSEGIIYAGEIYFWDGESAYVKGCRWTPEHGRPILGHVIYHAHHGQIPDKHTVIHADGNKNNFTPANLKLRSMAACAVMNQVFLRLRRDPKNPVLKAKADNVINALLIGRVQSRRAMAATLLQQFHTPQTSTGLLSQLQRRKQDEND